MVWVYFCLLASICMFHYLSASNAPPIGFRCMLKLAHSWNLNGIQCKKVTGMEGVKLYSVQQCRSQTVLLSKRICWDTVAHICIQHTVCTRYTIPYFQRWFNSTVQKILTHPILPTHTKKFPSQDSCHHICQKQVLLCKTLS